MNFWKPLHGLAIPIVLALLLSAVAVTPVVADDDIPSGAPFATEVPLEEHDPAESEPAMDVNNTPPIVATNQDGVNQPLVIQETGPSEEITISETLAEVPEDTDVIVLDENGEIIPLATEGAGVIIAEGDPIWCPSGVAKPTPSANGCSPSFTTFNGLGGLWVWLSLNDPNTSGTIWIEKTYDSASAGETGAITFDGSTFTNLDQFNLTIKGGWNGAGTGTVDTTDASIFNGNSLSIMNWVGNVTLSDIWVVNVASNPNNNAALYVQTEGNIKADRIWGALNTGAGTPDGAHFSNAIPGKSGSVTITNSYFSVNDTRGLIINTNGAVTLKNVTTNDNGTADGTIIINNYDGTASLVTVINSTFNSNGDGAGDHGLQIVSNGSVTLTDIQAHGNFADGVNVLTTLAGANVTLTNTNVFVNNAGNGLYVITLGNITAKHLVANDNGLDGVYFSNTAAGVAKVVTISGSGEFKGNGSNGLSIQSTGAVTINNITAVLNLIDGVNIDNTWLGSGAPAVKVNGSNIFNDNGNVGLYIFADGVITVNKITANNNDYGVRLINWGSIASQNVHVNGFLTAMSNTLQGLYIDTEGAVIAANLITGDNGDQGTYITNSASSLPKPVSITGTNIFNLNKDEGLFINTKGAVTLNNITANANGLVGDVSGVYIHNAYDAIAQPAVTLNGAGVFNNNSFHGLQINSYGMVTLNNVTAVENGLGVSDGAGEGLRVINIGGTVTKPVLIKGINIFNGNDANGMYITSHGAITVNKSTANNNGLKGIYLANSGALSPQAISAFGYLNASANGDEGIYITSIGTVTAANLTTNNNGQEGTYIANINASQPKAVTLTGINNFNNNGNEGLRIFTYGAVRLNNLTATWNGFTFGNSGVQIDNSYDPSIQHNVTLLGYNLFNNNGYHGLVINSFGSITLYNITAIENGLDVLDNVGNGVTLENNSGNIIKPVTLNGLNIFNFNDGSGLDVNSDGAITVNKITASNNGEDGAHLDNLGPVQSNISVTGYGLFEENVDEGLEAFSNGAITTSNLTAAFNNGNGVYMTTSGSAPKTIKLNGNNTFTYNGTAGVGNGLTLFTNGAITANNLNASHNQYNGAYLSNTTSLTAAPVTLTGFGSFVNNAQGNGLYISSYGNVLLNHVTADSNGNNIADNGISILTDGNVTLLCSSAYANFGDGLNVRDTAGTGAANVLMLKGFIGSMNNDDEDFLYTTLVRLPCP